MAYPRDCNVSRVGVSLEEMKSARNGTDTHFVVYSVGICEFECSTRHPFVGRVGHGIHLA